MGREVGLHGQHGNTHAHCIGGQSGILESIPYQKRGEVGGACTWVSYAKVTGSCTGLPELEPTPQIIRRVAVLLGSNASDNREDHSRDVHETDAGKHAPC